MSIANDSTTVQAVITKELKQWLQRQAKMEGRSLSNYVSFLLEQAQKSGEESTEVNIQK